MAKKLQGLELLEHLRSGNVVMELRRGNAHIIFRDTGYKDKSEEEIRKDCKKAGDTIRRVTERAYKGLTYEEGKALWEHGLNRKRLEEEACGAVEWIQGKPEPCENYKSI